MYIIAGLYRHRRLSSPKGQATRPTASQLRESVFNICQNSIEGARFLDLFAGSGAMGLEALSRGAQCATFIDQNKEAIRCIQQNVEHLEVKGQTKILHGNAFQLLSMLHEQQVQFDIIYADPPYKTPASPHQPTLYYSEKIIRWIDEHALLAPQGTLFIEESFEAQPKIHHLKTLELKKSRRTGAAVLQQYQYL